MQDNGINHDAVNHLYAIVTALTGEMVDAGAMTDEDAERWNREAVAAIRGDVALIETGGDAIHAAEQIIRAAAAGLDE